MNLSLIQGSVQLKGTTSAEVIKNTEVKTVHDLLLIYMFYG